jgi:hypothetical protein
MKRAILCLSVLLALAAQGTAGAAEPHRASRTAFKGYELYSWQVADGAWRYSLLAGTNRAKTNGEVTSAAVTMNDVSELKSRLAALAVNEQVFWFLPDAAGFAFPDARVVEDLKVHCDLVRVNLQVLQ